MCVRICRADRVTAPWDHVTGTITIPAELTADRAVTAVRAVLTALAVQQPGGRAICWCGADVAVPAPTRDEVVAHGA